MHARTLKRLVDSVQQPWFWDFGNEVLYQLCRKHPRHSDASIAAAKVWLIGRSYAAAIEPRRVIEPHPGNFYRDCVAPEMGRSKIDERLCALKSIQNVTAHSFSTIVEAHKYVTDLFGRISGQDKRSLASKYLHFHAPALFFIYDSQGVKGMRKLSKITGRASKNGCGGDNEYRKFAEKCLALRDHIYNHNGVMLTPRQIDRLLLLLA
ncbi:MAG: hypothetical protein ABI409_21470 [Ramlibacter sp.]